MTPRHPLALAAELDVLINDTCEYAGDLEGTPDELMDRLISIKFKAIHLRHTLRAQAEAEAEAEAGLREALAYYADFDGVHVSALGQYWVRRERADGSAYWESDRGQTARAALAQAQAGAGSEGQGEGA